MSGGDAPGATDEDPVAGVEEVPAVDVTVAEGQHPDGGSGGCFERCTSVIQGKWPPRMKQIDGCFTELY